MAANQIQVLLAMVDAARSTLLAQVFMDAGAAVSLVRSHTPAHLLEQIQQHNLDLFVSDLEPDAPLLLQIRSQYPHLPIVIVQTQPAEATASAIPTPRDVEVWVLSNADSMVDRAADRVRTLLDRLGVPEVASDLSGARSTRENPERAQSKELESVLPVPQIQTGDGETRSASRKTDSSALQPLPMPAMVGSNPRMAEIRDMISKVAGTDVTVLIRGESGVGKEVVARLLFENSLRSHKPFVKVNCAAIPHDLLESELFGYEAGAFTGATRDKLGKFEAANHGTLFLDEIAEMHPMLQAKLLHVLQDGKFSRLGSNREIAVDVRILCATNKSLEQRVHEGSFREDLLYRINVVTICLPPLRERSDEIPILTDYLLRKYALQYKREFRRFSPEVTRQMSEYEWPGNIRELENLCKRFVIVGSETQILRELAGRHPRLEDGFDQDAVLPKKIDGALSAGTVAPHADSNPLHDLSLLEIGRRAAWAAERSAIQQMLEDTHWNRREAARRLQVSYKALLNKIKQIQMEEEAAASTRDGASAREN